MLTINIQNYVAMYTSRENNQRVSRRLAREGSVLVSHVPHSPSISDVLPFVTEVFSNISYEYVVFVFFFFLIIQFCIGTHLW